MVQNAKLKSNYDDDEKPHGSEFVSTIKPDGIEYEEKPIVDQSQYWTSIEEARKAFKSHGFSLDAINTEKRISAEKGIHANIGAEQFFRKVDISKQDIHTSIDVIHRQKALEYYKDAKGREQQRVKEWLTYGLRLEGVDWLGNIIKCGLEHEGRCEEPLKRIHVTVDENGRQHAEYKMQGTRYKYYIPFSKKAVDDLLAKYQTDKDSVIYVFRVPYGSTNVNEKLHNGDFTYKEFTENDFQTMVNLASQVGGPRNKKPVFTDNKRLIDWQ